MTTPKTDALMALADRYAFHIPGSQHSDEARAALLAALQEQAREGEAVANSAILARGRFHAFKGENGEPDDWEWFEEGTNCEHGCIDAVIVRADAISAPQPAVRLDAKNRYQFAESFTSYTEAQLRSEVERIRRETVEECVALRAEVEAFDKAENSFMRKAIELEAEVAKLRGLVAGRSAEYLAAHITYDKGYQDGRLDAEAALKPVAEIGVSVFTWLGDRPPAGTTLYRIEQP